MISVAVWLAVGLGCASLITQPRVWARLRTARGLTWLSRFDDAALRWYVSGYPVMVARMFLTWRALCMEAGLTVTRRASQAVLGGDLVVGGRELRPALPRLGLPVGWPAARHRRGDRRDRSRPSLLGAVRPEGMHLLIPSAADPKGQVAAAVKVVSTIGIVL